MNKPAPLRSRRRGSLLVVALLLSAIIALSLGSFINLANQSSKLSYRTFYAGAAMNAAETGLEQAMWAINKRVAGDTGVWAANGWEVTSGGAARRTFTLDPISGGATVEVKVYVSRANLVGNNPFVLSRSIITPPQGLPVERWVNITLSKRSRFAVGLVAKDSIRFSGNNASVDSYDSRLGAYTPGSYANRFDRGTAGSTSVQVGSLNLGNADIWGSAIVGTADASGLNVGTNGTVGPHGTPAGTVVPDHVQTNFTANFDDIAQPAGYTGAGSYSINSITGATTLPRATDPPASDGKYYYNINSISMSGNDSKILTINGPVIMRMAPTTGTVISLGGSASIAIQDPYVSGTVTVTPSLEIYTSADVDISGGGVANNGKPENFKLWGTRPQSNASAQSMTVSGNGVLSGIIYAPNGNISMKGGGNSGNVFGAIIGKTITVTGQSSFHYDEALADLDGDAPFGLDEWNEYVSYADRNTYASLVSF